MKLIIFLLSLSVFSASQAQTDLDVWSKVSKPTAGRAVQSIGNYTSGCLRGASELPRNGAGYQVMRLSRKRFYGHPNLVQYIEKLGQTTHAQQLGSLLIGDLGQARGGPTLTGHRSHQTGLDVDIWYLLSRDAAQRELSLGEREKWNSPSVLNAKANDINPAQWTTANEKVLEAAASAPEVDRIFVNAYIKKALCSHTSPRSWLQKIRPWFAHADHFHVRLKCAVGDFSCTKQDPIPAGDGCGADLAWWFSEEAKKPGAKTPAKKIVLPEECNRVISED